MKCTVSSATPLDDMSAIITSGKSWCIYGANNSGIARFVSRFSENNDSGKCPFPHLNAAVLSFARQQEIFEEEVRNDQTDFIDRLDPGTPAADFIRNPELHKDVIFAFNLHNCMEKGYRQLSSGESRKLILLGAISEKPDLLLIENPYDGVDEEGCRELDKLLHYLSQDGFQIIITVSNIGDIPDWCCHLAIIENGMVLLHGPKQEILRKHQERGQAEQASPLADAVDDTTSHHASPAELVRLKGGYARYGPLTIFTDLDLNVTRGQHTLVTGPNGSGKSTLLQMITGDNQNCYGNNLRILGIQRGSGESIWELKQHMGIVSPDLHRNYYVPGSALQAVLSGFSDSIGVYRKFSKTQNDKALQWLERVGLADKAAFSFRKLTYAEQRLCLIARALIKMPPLLILDEPTQGLDQNNRTGLLDFLERIAELKLSTILYASHRRDEFRPFFRQHIDLSAY